MQTALQLAIRESFQTGSESNDTVQSGCMSSMVLYIYHKGNGFGLAECFEQGGSK